MVLVSLYAQNYCDQWVIKIFFKKVVDEQEVDRKLGRDRVRRKGSEDEEEQGEDIIKVHCIHAWNS